MAAPSLRCQRLFRGFTAKRSAIRRIITKAQSLDVPLQSVQIHHEPEPRIALAADVFSGAPDELHHRTVRIFKPAKTPMQSGVHATRNWELEFDIPGKNTRWEHPLIGWAASSDYMQGTRLKFNTKDDAIHFAEKQG
ncbi:NADH-ubiquinone oxidoreductase subunit, mitochondrial [Neolecta irregularis DAH-3]|uniref:NADH dehydrogenase [ubiquinone] iron-sulfur protein 4, mitochondrial n=1 Tax=Neolecta irregularis (strain DAH-3) TaxID=1198029 RepID=A0A1U7LKL2_NEOID|nr:NADH-ubiquinone oxidoreductase subunit, mitochondrial [Neolecta irregularis DAH-3]|eukprot:OLL23061.1 NADH-ubiquinone oxidoreductase subunit, mitochondrial [Neolecta irregularis DAH-3]